MTPHALLEALKYWLPLTSFCGLLIKVYFTAKKAIGRWFDRIGTSFEGYLAKAVDNHMTHVQSDVNRAATAIVDLAQYHKESLETQRTMSVALVQMQTTMHDHMADDLRIQNAILTGIEVLKAKN